jgi:sulfur carrier protein ThiS
MRFVVNGAERAVETSPHSTLQDLLDGVYADMESTRQVVTGVALNGNLLQWEDEARCSTTAFETIETLEVTSQPFREFLAGRIREILADMERVASESRRAVTALSRGEVRSAVEQWSDLTDRLEVIRNLLTLLDEYFLYAGRVTKNGAPSHPAGGESKWTDLDVFLAKGFAAIASRDASTLSAIVQDGMLRIIEEWNRGFRQWLAWAEA